MGFGGSRWGGSMKARLFVAALALVAIAAGTYFYFWP
jgi:hypothetical protein